MDLINNEELNKVLNEIKRGLYKWRSVEVHTSLK